MAITLLGSAAFESLAQASPGPAVPYTSAGGTTLIAVIICSSPQTLGGISSITDSAGNTWDYSASSSQKPPSAVASGGTVEGVNLFGNWVASVAWCISAAAVTSVTIQDATGVLDCWYVSITEWSGIATAGIGVAVTGTGSPAPSLTLVSATDLVIGAACYSITEPPAGWSLLLPSLPLAGYAVPGAAGTYSPSWTAPGTQPYAAAVMSFRESRMTYEATVLADSPSFLWLLNENSGSTAADATGNGSTGAYSNNASPTAVHVPHFQSTATDFTGSHQSIDANGTLTAFQETSAECWFNTTAATGGGIIQYGATNFVVYMHNDGTLSFGVWTGSSAIVAGPTATAYNDGSWHHVVATFSGSGTAMKLYVDAAQVATATASAYVTGNSKWFVAAGGNVAGSWAGTQTDNNLLAYFAAAAVYPAVLSPAQITAHYNIGIGAGGTKYLTGSAVAALTTAIM